MGRGVPASPGTTRPDRPGDVRPRCAAAAIGAAFEVLDDLPQAHSDETIDSLFTFLRGGLAAMQGKTAAPKPPLALSEALLAFSGNR